MAQIRTVKGTCVPVKYLVLGMLQNNVYLISDGSATIVVDPSCKADDILGAANGSVDAIVLTHRHSDHVGAAKELRDKTGATVIASAVDAPSSRTRRSCRATTCALRRARSTTW